MASNDLDGTVTSEAGSGISRRDAIKKGAVVGGAVLWATPVVQSIGMSPASATHVSPGVPHPCPACPNCLAEATGLRALGLTAGTASGSGCQCVLNVNLNAGQIGGASSQTVCGRADSVTCSASSYVEGLVVRIADNARLEATVLSSCVSCGTGTSYVARLDLVTTLLGIDTRLQLNVGTGCNVGVAVPGFPLVQVVFNEQFCTDGTLTVRALRVTVLSLDVIAAESKAGGAGCPCTTCAETPTCTPPRSRLC